MQVFHNLVFIIIAIFDSIDSSEQFECLPNGAPIPGVPPREASPSVFERLQLSAEGYPSSSSTPHAEPSRRSRSRSPPISNRTSPIRLPFPKVFGYELDQLDFIRLIPYRNPQQEFRLQKYTFPVNKPIELLEGPHKYRRIPTQEQIVLSTLDGDVFAILESAETLTGIYTYDSIVYLKVRAKINMRNGEVSSLTADETREIPVGRKRRILNDYRVAHSEHHHGVPFSAEPQLRSSASSSSRHMTLPTKLPSSDGSGYGLHQLQFIRLIPMKNLNQIFALRRYTFPADKLILFLEGKHQYAPIPIKELIVLTTDSGDVFAILENDDNLTGIYTYKFNTGTKARVKINMQSGIVTHSTKQKIGEVPVGERRPILHNFQIQHVNEYLPRHPIE